MTSAHKYTTFQTVGAFGAETGDAAGFGHGEPSATDENCDISTKNKCLPNLLSYNSALPT